MFDFENFESIMNECKGLCDANEELAKVFGSVAEDGIIDRAVVRILSAIADDMDDIGDESTMDLPYIIFYAFECDFGRKPKNGLDSLEKVWEKII